MYDYRRGERAVKAVAVLAMVLGLALFLLDRFGIHIPTVGIPSHPWTDQVNQDH